jgi:hypothetical protein
MPEQSTHKFVDIKEIKEGIVTLNNKSLRTVLMVSSINFDLKSGEEKQALISSFQQFLNSLDFTIQIVIHSRPLDLTDYFSFLREQQGKQENELLKIQTSEYLDFIQELIKLSSIMSKFFYVVIPYNMAIIKKSGIIDKFLPNKKSTNAQDASLTEAKNKLQLRVSQVIGLLAGMGLRAIPLQDKELAELYYGLYNPGVVLKQKNLELLIATGQEEKQTE